MGKERQRLLVVRHGETEWSHTGRHTGRTDMPLDESGRDRARHLRPLLAAWAGKLVFSSPLSRARETASLAGFGDGVTIDPDLTEWDYGDYDGTTTADIRAGAPGWSLWLDGAPGGEDVTDVGRRADAFLERVRGRRGENAVVFAHGHFLRVLAARWIELPPIEGRRLPFDTAHYGILGFEHETPGILLWNAG